MSETFPIINSDANREFNRRVNHGIALLPLLLKSGGIDTKSASDETPSLWKSACETVPYASIIVGDTIMVTADQTLTNHDLFSGYNANGYFYEMISYQVVQIDHGQIEIIKLINQEHPILAGWPTGGAAPSAIISPPPNAQFLIRKRHKLTSQLTGKDSNVNDSHTYFTHRDADGNMILSNNKKLDVTKLDSDFTS
jgi:hypothetical protein